MPSDEEQYLSELENRKIPKEQKEVTIPDTEGLFRLDPMKIAEVVVRVLAMDGITKMVLEIDQPMRVTYYGNTTYGKGMLDESKTLVSKKAALTPQEMEMELEASVKRATMALERFQAFRKAGAVPPPPEGFKPE